ncbi:bcl-2-binding component 3 [Phaenicophaeus curvirostris]|uniref:bcl-2-binding component 3 n=1 Tax=Phaenicophaeus curvirostris TaxID=33595 RepID=UPI0037F0BD1F
MAKPLREGSPPRRQPPRLSCPCGPPPAGPPPSCRLYRCGAPPAHGDFHPPGAGEHPQSEGGSLGAGGGAAVPVPNGLGAPPGAERELGARLRRLGDAFQRSHEQQQQQRGLFWGPLYRLVSQLLGAVPLLPAARGGI